MKSKLSAVGIKCLLAAGAVLMAAMLSFATLNQARADIIVNFPEIDYTQCTGTNCGLIDYSTQTFTIPAGDIITGATFSGTWNASSEGCCSGAAASLYLDGILVSQQTSIQVNISRGFTFTFTPSELADLSSGSAELSFIQQDGYLGGRVSGTTLDIQVQSPVPGPIAGTGLPGLIFLGGGLLVWWRNKRKARAVA